MACPDALWAQRKDPVVEAVADQRRGKAGCGDVCAKPALPDSGGLVRNKSSALCTHACAAIAANDLVRS
jgi:hypothetical protein